MWQVKRYSNEFFIYNIGFNRKRVTVKIIITNNNDSDKIFDSYYELI